MTVFKSKVSPKGQITLPTELRKIYHLKEGEEVILMPGKEGVIVKHVPSSLRGRLKNKLDLQGFEKDVREIRKKWRL